MSSSPWVVSLFRGVDPAFSSVCVVPAGWQVIHQSAVATIVTEARTGVCVVRISQSNDVVEIEACSHGLGKLV